MATSRLSGVLLVAQEAWATDSAALVASETDAFAREETQRFARSLQRAYAIGWDISLRRVALAELSRTQSMLNGPLFTSDAYPWPTDRERLMIPIVQVDLAEVSRLSKMPLGVGLLQLWHGAHDMMTRVIPREALVSPSDIPTLIPGENLERYHFEVGHFGLPAFLTNAHQIVGFDGPYLFGPRGLDASLERWIASPAVTKRLKGALRTLQREVARGRESHRQFNRLFGSFDGIQIYPEDRPPALFSSDDDSILNTGDAGVIALYYDMRADGVAFSADFQCC